MAILYLEYYHNPIFVPIKGGSHNYDNLKHINEVINNRDKILELINKMDAIFDEE